MNNEKGELSLKLHYENNGKIELKSKISIKNREDLSLAYTPGVARVSEEIGKDKNKVFDYTIKKNTVAVVSDGSAILGLGNLGPEAAIPVMEGKALIFKEFAGIDAFPICLNTQNTEEIIETVKRIAPVFGGINLEDISAPRCFEIEKRLRKELDIPVMHDDQHGTATVVLAGLINSLKLKKMKKEEARVVINGAGSAGNAIFNLLKDYGFNNILVLDSKGIISENRNDLDNEKLLIAKSSNPNKTQGGLHEALLGADIFIGVSKGGILNESLVKDMNKDPIIFGLANPIPEIMPDLAIKAGAFVVATGRSDFPNQVNNALVFPGIFKGMLTRKVSQFDNQLFIRVAESVASHVSGLSRDNILPDIFDKELVSVVSKAVVS